MVIVDESIYPLNILEITDAGIRQNDKRIRPVLYPDQPARSWGSRKLPLECEYRRCSPKIP